MRLRASFRLPRTFRPCCPFRGCEGGFPPVFIGGGRGELPPFFRPPRNFFSSRGKELERQISGGIGGVRGGVPPNGLQNKKELQRVIEFAAFDLRDETEVATALCYNFRTMTGDTEGDNGDIWGDVRGVYCACRGPVPPIVACVAVFIGFFFCTSKRKKHPLK
jgi:hypothetical protein